MSDIVKLLTNFSEFDVKNVRLTCYKTVRETFISKKGLDKGEIGWLNIIKPIQPSDLSFV